MKPYEELEPVLGERSELSEKSRKLREFIKSDAFRDVSGVERNLLVRQLEAMTAYGAALSARIAIFRGKR